VRNIAKQAVACHTFMASQMMGCCSLVNHTLSSGWHLLIGDYKCSPRKSLVKCLYLFGSEELTIFVGVNILTFIFLHHPCIGFVTFIVEVLTPINTDKYSEPKGIGTVEVYQHLLTLTNIVDSSEPKRYRHFTRLFPRGHL